MGLSNLDREERLRLMKFVCSFAWADLEVADQERSFVHKMMKTIRSVQVVALRTRAF